jgi:hypothetical protein
MLTSDVEIPAYLVPIKLYSPPPNVPISTEAVNVISKTEVEMIVADFEVKMAIVYWQYKIAIKIANVVVLFPCIFDIYLKFMNI